MTTVGFITTPLTSGHAVRGVGFYTKRLLDHIKPIAKDLDFEIIEVKSLEQLGQLEQLDIVHYPYFDLFHHTLPFVKKNKTIVTIHDVIPLEFPDYYPPGIRGWANLQLQKLALSGVERVITDSFYSLTKINQFLGVPPHKLRLVYLAADQVFKKIAHPANKYNLPKKFVLYVGDVNYNKNIENLVLACQKVGLPLVIVGKQAAEIDSLKSESNLFKPRDLIRNILGQQHPQLSHLINLKSLFINQNVITLGFVDNLVDIYNFASVYCQPSLSEGFGLPVLEAQACGTPVTCSRAGSLPEIAGDTAVYFDPYNISDMAAAITAAKKQKRVVVNNFSWDTTARQTLQVYSELV